MEKGKRVKLIVNVYFVLRAVGDGTPDWGTESDSSERSEGVMMSRYGFRALVLEGSRFSSSHPARVC